MNKIPWARKGIKCCKDCVPPKRYPGCGDHCKEYQEEKAKLAAAKKKEKEYKDNNPVLNYYDFNRY